MHERSDAEKPERTAGDRTDAPGDKQLRAELVGFARRLLSRWPELRALVEPDDLVQGALEKELKASLQGHGPTLSRLGFLKSAVRHLAVDIHRRRSRHPGDLVVDELRERLEGSGSSPSDMGDRRPPPLPADVAQGLQVDPSSESEADETAATVAAQALRNRMVRLRSALDRLGSRQRGRQAVDFHAVLVFRLRLVLVARLGSAAKEDDSSPADLAERLLPWTAPERSSSFRPLWPSINTLWSACRPDVDAPPHLVDAIRLGERLQELTDSTATLTIDVWYQWGLRAKTDARRATGEHEWSEVFAGFLPDRRREPKP